MNSILESFSRKSLILFRFAAIQKLLMRSFLLLNHAKLETIVVKIIDALFLQQIR